ncbi:glycosyltransferase family 2 protein [Chryseobacterium carnipullorum]|uniref:Glycosyltransferase family 2 protein n=1 Tax=Chryseobacterium carnipullorum TaxID=1124835 RepID=A0A1M7N2W8_CHRCU|nr:glycosyltransferase family 2 protein [Chryseobacterium carnipullorum]AZA49971.1 glycosyltransferase family 2 protein [Chryseobacterium carnipullorum]AZA64850.1 glycosyltransferase family 2 protein [Chryseobacterium carnipullorum]SHM97761.1 Glycosyltransferase, GT2 family [Chryseobacterium carnipullorum]STC96443.1 dTDP-Rha:alpha-D-GlcNAc-pyrophosphate polyprenol, alpha-3-L-rhamnosyltransferase [Chryseobacterium carnipullorum]
MPTNLAVAILNWNGKNWLEKFLPDVVRFSQNADIYVIDNLSTDDSIDFIERQFPTVKIIRNDKNYGFAGGYNEGLKEIKNEYYCLLNSDVEVTENWINPVMDLFEKDASIAAVQPKILSFNNKNYFEFAGAAGGLIDNLGYPYCRGRIFDSLEEDKGQYDDEKEIFWASGCCFFIRSKDFWAQKGFDERFFAHQEEIDLCWRLINSGKKIFYTGKSKVYHVGGGTLNKQSAQKTYLNMRNNLSMMVKNLPFPQLIGIISLRLVLDGFAGVYFGLKNGFAHFWAVLRAHFGFYGQLPGTWKLRQKNQKDDFYQSKWLIFKHFLGGK